uniref:Uncharacterized protein n=1 Tax=Oryza glumipatula TaxID=40148 RepID=A0A0D9YEQ4_9ORYZ
MATLLSDAKRVCVLAESLLLGPPGVFPTRTPNLVSTVGFEVHPWASTVWRIMDGVNEATQARVEFRVQTSQVHFTRSVQEKQRTIEKQRNRVPTPPFGIKTSSVVEDESQE